MLKLKNSPINLVLIILYFLENSMYKFRNPNIDLDENQENQIEGIISSSISMITCKLNEIMRIFNN